MSANGTRTYSACPPGIPSEHVRVAEEARRRVPEDLLRHPRVRVRVLAEREHLVSARRTEPARDGERNDHAITDLELVFVDLRADLDDLAHELVAENVALLHRRHEAVVEV